MKKIVALIAMLLMFMLPALITPAFAASHAKAADATTADTDTKKKKKEAEEEDEEPECD